jgi:putative membrane protein
MFPCTGFGYGFWWIFPVIMIVMMVLCFLRMRGRKGSLMCSSGFRDKDSHSGDTSDSALDVLNKRYAEGEISKEEYEEKRSVITRHN